MRISKSRKFLEHEMAGSACQSSLTLSMVQIISVTANFPKSFEERICMREKSMILTSKYVIW